MNAVVGANALVKLGFRRDRIILPVWLYALLALSLGSAWSIRGLYPTVQSRVSFGTALTGNPALRAFTGPIFDATTVGGLTAWRMATLGGVLLGLMNIFTVVRHTRAEEEAGRLELIGAGVVGRHAAFVAALVMVAVMDLVIGVLIALGMIALGQDVAGSFAFGLSTTVVGLVFAGVAALTAQLTESSRGANGIAITVLGAAFVLRAVGDSAAAAGPRWLTWLSPIGWTEQVQAYATNRWWVLVLSLALAVLLVGLAARLAGRRDLGAGLLPSRPGPALGAPGLRTPLSLAWRMHRGPLLGWTIGFGLVGLVYGAITPAISGLVGTSAQVARIIAEMGGSTGLVNSFIATIFALFGLVAAVYTVQATLRLRAEESAQRAEPLLATAVSRTSWVASHLVFAVLGPVVLLLAAGLFLGIGEGVSAGSMGRSIGDALLAAAVQLPAAWVLTGLGLALFGWLPRLVAASWGVLVVFLALGQLGPMLHVPQWAMDVSPFTHVPKLPGGSFDGAPMGWLLLIAIALSVAGFAGFRRRDLAT